MNTLDEDFAAELRVDRDPPCLSLYQPTHRHHPDNQQDPIRFGNLVKMLGESLAQRYTKDEAEPLLAPFLALAANREFWNSTLDGLVVLGAKDMFRTYYLQRSVAELAVVADSFHTKPLLRILQTVERFHVLGLNRHAIRLFEGNPDVLDEIRPADGVPRTIFQALGEELTESHQTVASYGGPGAGQAPMHHGHGGKADEVDIDAERFFRAVDRGILEHHSQPSGLPLILAALPEHHHLFREVSRNPHLLAEGIDFYPDTSAAIDKLRRQTWQLVEPRHREQLNALVEEFGNARSRGLGSEELAEIAVAVMGGRVSTLLVEDRRVIPGRIDPVTGEISFTDLTHPDVDDVLDDLGESTLKMGGQVVVVPEERMPTRTGIAAIYRY